MKKMIIAISSLCLVAAIGTGGYAYYRHPVEYLSLDINPSVELGVNAIGKVVSAQSYNDDGQTILSGQNVTNKTLTDAVNTLVKSAANNGFVADDGSTVVAVTAETDNDTDAAKLTDEAEQGVDSAISDTDKQAVVYKDNVALARRDEARQLGITPGKLNLIQKLQALDPTITVDQYKDAKVTDIMKKTVELRKEAKKSDTSTTEPTDSSDTTAAAGTDTTIDTNANTDTNTNTDADIDKDSETSETDPAYQGIEKAVEQSDRNKADKAKGNDKKDAGSTTVSEADSTDANTEPTATMATSSWNNGKNNNGDNGNENKAETCVTKSTTAQTQHVTKPTTAATATAPSKGSDNKNNQGKANQTNNGHNK